MKNEKFKKSDYYKSEKHIKNVLNASKCAIIEIKKLKIKRIEEYNKNPKRCLKCHNKIEYEKRKNTFCSKSCSVSYNNRKRNLSEKTKEKISKSLKKDKIEYVNLVCEYCKKEFKVPINKKRKKYCNNECIKSSKKLNKKPKKTYKERICEECGKSYIPKYYNKNQRFCSQSCSSRHVNTGKKLSKETKQKLSKIMSDKIKNGDFKPKLTSIKCEYVYKKKKIRCDSKVEYSCLDYFEKNFDIINIERCNFLIEFEFNGTKRNYNPDFKITTTEGIYIVECKTIISNKKLQRKWSYYYDTIPYKKECLIEYCKENDYKYFFYDKSLNITFYNKLRIK